VSVHALDIPNDPHEIARWLDGHLVGPSLAELVAELAAARSTTEPAAPTVSLDEVLGEGLAGVLEHGLLAVEPVTRTLLLARPVLLLDLQERVLVEGGDYWDHLAADVDDHDPDLERRWQRLRASIARPGLHSNPARQPARLPTSRPWAVAGLASLCTAAAMLLAMFAWQRWSPQPAAPQPGGWGWNRTEALAADAPPAEYLRGLAESAAEWFDREPTTRAELAARIVQFRHGCSTLMLSDHPPLSDADRVWLQSRCRLWADKLNAHLVDLESGRDIVDVRSDVDGVVLKLVEALETRARSV
jgi:hypothetical protein